MNVHTILPPLIVFPTGGNIIPKSPVIKVTINYQFRNDLGIIIPWGFAFFLTQNCGGVPHSVFSIKKLASQKKNKRTKERKKLAR